MFLFIQNNFMPVFLNLNQVKKDFVVYYNRVHYFFVVIHLPLNVSSTTCYILMITYIYTITSSRFVINDLGFIFTVVRHVLIFKIMKQEID